MYCTDINCLIPNNMQKDSINITAKIRYLSKESNAILYKISENLYKVEFEEPQRAVTEGQSIVFYDINIVLGGGIITKNHKIPVDKDV